MKKIGTDKIHAQQYLNNTKSRKKTDNSKYEKSRTERLFLYVLGKSQTPLSIRQIEKQVQQIVKTERPNYVYDIRDKLAPVETEVPNILLLKSDDFFDRNKELKDIASEDLEKLKKRILTKIFEVYGFHLGWENVTNLILTSSEICKNPKCIEIIIREKNNNNQVRIILSPQRLKSKLFINNSKIPIIEKRTKRSNHIYSIQLFPFINLRRYVDMEYPNNQQKTEIKTTQDTNYIVAQIRKVDPRSIVRESHFTLNLRGLLYYTLLNLNCKSGKITDKLYMEMNKVIEKLSRSDRYQDMENEFIRFNPVRKCISLDKEKTILIENQRSGYYLKIRFPFLSFYDEFKHYLPINFAIQTLMEISLELQNKLGEMDIAEIKYFVTEKFFLRLEWYFWQSHMSFDFPYPQLPKIERRKIIDDRGFFILEKYQKEIRTYLMLTKERELESLKKDSAYYERRNYENQISRKMYNILEQNKEKLIISLREYFKYEDERRIISSADLNAINMFCSFDRRLIQIDGKFLIRIDILKEKIGPMLRSEMTVEEIDDIFYNLGIPEELWNKGYKSELTREIVKKLNYNFISIDEQDRKGLSHFRIIANTN